MNKSFLRSQKLNTMYTAMAITGGVLFGLSIVVGVSSGSSSLVLLILGIIMLATKDTPVLLFQEKFCEVKAAPMAPRIFIKYDNIKDVRTTKKNIEIDVADSHKPVKIALSLFNKEEHDEITTCFENLIKGE